MGGLTWQTKEAILTRMLIAEDKGKRACVDELASLTSKKKNTISGHLRTLEMQGFVVERDQRGRWFLTLEGRIFARSLLPAPSGIAFRGIIAAGPAVPIVESTEEYLDIPEYVPERFFALRVKGTSMVSFGICDGDLVIMRKVTNWLEVPEGAIVAARVPEGTGANVNDWIEYTTVCCQDSDLQPPPLDHITLKKLDARLYTYVRQGVAHQQMTPRLKGSAGTLYPIAMAVAGVLVEQRRTYRW